MKSELPPKAFGGYFELELPPQRQNLYPEAIPFQSARAAFQVLLKADKPNRVWLPWYLCDTMLQPARAAGIEVVRYHIDENFKISSGVKIQSNDCILYVNYFGLCADVVCDAYNRFPPDRLIIDNSQALFAFAPECLATIYSPRKFIGIPDGGLLITKVKIIEPNEEDSGSVVRCVHLLKRLGSEPEDGYADYLQAEASLQGQLPRCMSRLTQRLIGSMDFISIAKRRRDNYQLLQSRFSDINRLQFVLSPHDIPLCYPLLQSSGQAVRERLIQRRVFLPSYWQDVIKNEKHISSWELMLARETLFLPCDQRYTVEEISTLADIVYEQLGENK